MQTHTHKHTLKEPGAEVGGWAYNTSWAYNTYSTVLLCVLQLHTYMYMHTLHISHLHTNKSQCVTLWYTVYTCNTHASMCLTPPPPPHTHTRTHAYTLTHTYTGGYRSCGDVERDGHQKQLHNGSHVLRLSPGQGERPPVQHV